jgi:hypothetical protein
MGTNELAKEALTVLSITVFIVTAWLLKLFKTSRIVKTLKWFCCTKNLVPAFVPQLHLFIRQNKNQNKK